MLDNITVRSVPGSDAGITAGSLAELLLFYGSVHLILDYGRLGNLLRSVGPENLDFLISNKFIKITYSLSQSGVRTEKTGPFEVHDFIEFQLGGKKPMRPTIESQVGTIYDRVLPDLTRRGYFAKRLISSSERLSDIGNAAEGSKASALAADSILDDHFIGEATKVILQTLVPGVHLPADFAVRAFRVNGGFAYDTNLDFRSINAEYHKIFSPEHSSVTPAYILDFIWQSALDLNLAARYGTELLTGRMSSRLIELRVGNILGKVSREEATIRAFSDFVFSNGRTIKEVIDSGERSFEEFRDILVKSRRFRDWLLGINPDGDVLKEYHRASIEGTWVEKLPAKGTRFAFFTAAGMTIDAAFPTGMGTAAGIALGAADSFILDRLLSGWKPSHFVDSVLGDFVEPPDQKK